MTTVAQIADAALDAVSAAITDAVQSASLARDTQGAYNYDTGTYAVTTTTQTGRAVVDGTAPVEDIFPEYVLGPSDRLVLLEGFTSCKEGDRLTYGGETYEVQKWRDLVGTGTLFYVVCR